MSITTIRYESILTTIQRANALIDYDIHNDLRSQHEFQKSKIYTDQSLTMFEKFEAEKELDEIYERNKVLHNEGTKVACEICNNKRLATLYCEYCIRNYLKKNFSNWTSGNGDVDDLIQKYQIGSFRPDNIVEWIPYNNLQHIEHLTKGGFSEIYTAVWMDGKYEKWDFEGQQLKRLGDIKVVLKSIKNVENASQSWFEEAKSHLTISNKWPQFVQCFGLTQDPSNGNYMLVMYKMDIDLRKYLQLTHNRLTWKERIKIIYDIILAIGTIHSENAMHRDLHAGNILYLQLSQKWYISDFGFYGPANKPLNSIYGNLPYIAPEVIAGKEYTFASDIYSIAMLMWEISSGQPPFNNYEHDRDLATKTVTGIRPKVMPGTPLKYITLMEQCWDADPLKRPDINTLVNSFFDMHHSYYQNIPNDLSQLETNSTATTINSSEFKFSDLNLTSERLSDDTTEKIRFNRRNTTTSSGVYRLEDLLDSLDLLEPRNATEEELEEFHNINIRQGSDYNIEALNIEAWNIEAWDIEARDIETRDIEAQPQDIEAILNDIYDIFKDFKLLIDKFVFLIKFLFFTLISLIKFKLCIWYDFLLYPIILILPKWCRFLLWKNKQN